MLRSFGFTLLFVLLLASLLVGALGGLLALVAHTTPGRLAGLGSLALASVPWLLLFERARRWLAVPLVGLSNGGLGVTRALEAYPERFEGVLYITGVVEPQRMAQLELPPDLPVLLLAGGADRRLPIELEREAAQALPQAEILEAPRQDHFLMFRDPALVAEALARLGR